MAATSNPALALLAKSIADVVGANSELYRDVLRAVESDEYVDIMLAQASFDTLSSEIKREISGRVDDLVAQYLAKGQSAEEMAEELAGDLPDSMA
jgi:transaldolase